MDADVGSVQLPWWQKIRWRQYSRSEALEAERSLLALAETPLSRKDTHVGPSKEEFVHSIHAGEGNTSSPAIVYVPGYGLGVGVMFRCYEGLAAGWRTFAVDPLGTGLSGRPPFKARNTQQAEDFFINALAKWREEQGIDKFILVGHSMGGYLSAVYALRHPSHVQHLVLVCPAGIGKRPEGWQPPAAVRDPWTVRGQVFRMAKTFWDWGLTPGSVIRAAGPWGPRFTEGYTRRRFKQGHALTEEETVAFHRYAYAVLAAKGSGEFALRHILAPFAFPRQPLEDRLPELKSSVPLTFIYGEHDWMDFAAAERTTKKIAAAREDSSQRLATSDLKVLYTMNAGHYPMIDQPGAFLENLLEAVGEYLPADAVARVKAAAAKRPFVAKPVVEDAERLREEMKSNPAAAETHVATDL